MSKPMHIDEIFKQKALLATETAEYIVDLNRLNAEGYFSLQVVWNSGAGVIKAEYNLSNDGVNYIEPTDAEDIFTGFTEAQGPGNSDTDIFTFTPDLARFIKIVITETGEAAPINFDVILAIQ